jgi:hypothetical protein
MDFAFLDEIHICALTSGYTAAILNRFTDELFYSVKNSGLNTLVRAPRVGITVI